MLIGACSFMDSVAASKYKIARRTSSSYCAGSILMTYFMVADGGVGDARSNAICPKVVIALTPVAIGVEIWPLLRTCLRLSIAPNHLRKKHKM